MFYAFTLEDMQKMASDFFTDPRQFVMDVYQESMEAFLDLIKIFTDLFQKPFGWMFELANAFLKWIADNVK